MRRIDTPDELFAPGSPATGTKGTPVRNWWLNVIQEELAGAVEGFGGTLDPADSSQVFDTLVANLAGRLGNASNVFRVSQAVGASDATPLSQVQALISDISDPYGFYKLESGSPAFTKTSASTISIKAGTKIMVAGVAVNIAADTAIVMPALTAGTDYAIYACTDGTVRADASFTAPAGYTTETSRLIGGFHYGLVAPGTTVAGGSFATTGNGMIWTQADVDLIAGINAWSIWDLRWRSAANDLRGQKGFSFIYPRGEWLACYLSSTDIDANGLSRAGTNIASGAVLPKKPVMYGGNGILTYPSLDWFVATEMASVFGCELLDEGLFNLAAYGVTENQSIDTTDNTTYPTTQRNAGYTSKYGIEQATGHLSVWGVDTTQNYNSATALWKNVVGGRGQVWSQGNFGVARVIMGGTRNTGVYAGSHCAFWETPPWASNWSLGLRAKAKHLKY